MSGVIVNFASRRAVKAASERAARASTAWSEWWSPPLTKCGRWALTPVPSPGCSK
jgi:hypothetical protein